MVDEREQRRLAAILHADVVGYSRMMGVDESGTHDRLKALHSDVIDPKIAAYDGHIVHTAGDGTLVEFPSAVDAVQFALDVQQVIAQCNEDVPDGQRIVLRIGINVGDIIVDADDIFGDGVNVATRLEGLAPPGGICISHTVYDQVRNKLDLDFVDMGLQALKNIVEPVQAYRLGVEGVPAPESEWTRSVYRRPIAVFASIVVLIIAAAVVNSQYGPGFLSSLPFLGEKEVTSLTPILDKPSLAVLPFNNLSEDPNQEYFVDGMSEDLITDLSRISGLFVISRHSTFVYKGKRVDVRTVGRDLGVRYILEGSVRKVANMLRINAQLIDAESRAHVWAGRYDREVTGIFKVQDEISAKIVAALKVTLTAKEILRSGNTPTVIYPAYDAYLLGWAHYRQNTYADFLEAVRNLRKAILLDPNFSLAHAALAATYLAARRSGWRSVIKRKSPEDSLEDAHYTDQMQLENARVYLERAMENPTPLAYRVAAEIATLDRDYDQAKMRIEQAIVLDPNDADNFAQLSIIRTWAGEAEKAIESIERAMRLNPHYPGIYSAYLGIAEFARGYYVKSRVHLERSAARNPDNDWLLVHLTAAYGYLGERQAARKTLLKLNSLTRQQKRPEYTVKEARRRTPYKFEADTHRLLMGLHAAGMRNVLIPFQ